MTRDTPLDAQQLRAHQHRNKLGVPCAINGCDRKAYVRGWCIMHYSRWQNHGDPLATSYRQIVATNHDGEEWQDIAGYAGIYQISTLGRVRALRFKNGHVDTVLAEPVVLSPGGNSQGAYLKHTLSRDNVKKNHMAHRLVLETFGPPQPPNTEAGHLDGNNKNNSINNLAWVTTKENARHRSLHGTQHRGETCYNAKLTAAAVLDIRATYKRGNSATLAAKYGVGKSHIQKIVAGKCWSHV